MATTRLKPIRKLSWDDEVIGFCSVLLHITNGCCQTDPTDSLDQKKGYAKETMVLLFLVVIVFVWLLLLFLLMDSTFYLISCFHIEHVSPCLQIDPRGKAEKMEP